MPPQRSADVKLWILFFGSRKLSYFLPFREQRENLRRAFGFVDETRLCKGFEELFSEKRYLKVAFCLDQGGDALSVWPL
jgi:hypothetical protein